MTYVDKKSRESSVVFRYAKRISEDNIMNSDEKIITRGLTQNNLKNVSLEIPKGKIIVFTGVSGSGKSSIVFDTIAAESQRQMNETYSAFIKGRLPKYEKPKAEKIENLSASVIVDQSRLGGNARSTVGTISDMHASLRLLFSRIGTPYAGTASYFSFNDPNGMCPECYGIGKVMRVNAESKIDPEKHGMKAWLIYPLFMSAIGIGNNMRPQDCFPLIKNGKILQIRSETACFTAQTNQTERN